MGYLDKLRKQNEEASRARLKEATEALRARKSTRSTQSPAPIQPEATDPWKGENREADLPRTGRQEP